MLHLHHDLYFEILQFTIFHSLSSFTKNTVNSKRDVFFFRRQQNKCGSQFVALPTYSMLL